MSASMFTPRESVQSDRQGEEIEESLEYQNSDASTSVQKYTNLLQVQMAANKLQEAERKGDREGMRNALEKLLDQIQDIDPKLETTSYQGMINDARQKLRRVNNFAVELSQLCDSSNPSVTADQITAVVKKISDTRHDRFLQEEIREALGVADDLRQSDRKPFILALDKKTMSELKSYSKPSPIVHRVMQATFLLLGEDEEKTATWRRCQALCNPDGPNGLNRKMVNFEPEDVHPYIKSRVQKILKGVSLEEIQKASPGAATFFVWVKSVVPEDEDDVETADNTAPVSPGRPAKPPGDPRLAMARIVQREREIFAMRNGGMRMLKKTPRHSQHFYRLT